MLDRIANPFLLSHPFHCSLENEIEMKLSYFGGLIESFPELKDEVGQKLQKLTAHVAEAPGKGSKEIPGKEAEEEHEDFSDPQSEGSPNAA